MGASRIFSYNSLLQRIDRGNYNNYNPRTGVDRGIVRLGSFVEEGLHNWGHEALSEMRLGSGQTPIGTTTGSARDPIFYRWHVLIDSIFRRYKDGLGHYPGEELGFEGVVVDAKIRSVSYPDNVLMTGIVRDTVAMSSLRRGTRGAENLQVNFCRIWRLSYDVRCYRLSTIGWTMCLTLWK